MWNQNEATRRLQIRHPVIQGPFGGGLSTTQLAAAVSNAGGLGSFGASALSGESITDLIAELHSLTQNPFAVNLWIPRETAAQPDAQEFERNLSRLDRYYLELGIARPVPPVRYGQDFDSQVRALIEAQPPVFSFVYGVPDNWILQACRERGIVTLGTATTPEEGATLESAGVDCIIASGIEAGGHRGAFLRPEQETLMSTFALVPQVVDRVRVPVIAAGGIADARGIRAALALGALGVQIGTAFLACEESGATPAHRALILAAKRDDTVLTRAFTGRLARSIRNRFSEDMAAFEPELPNYPIQGWFAGTLRAAALASGRTDLTPLWAGQAAPLVHRQSATALFDELVSAMSE